MIFIFAAGLAYVTRNRVVRLPLSRTGANVLKQFVCPARDLEKNMVGDWSSQLGATIT